MASAEPICNNDNVRVVKSRVFTNAEFNFNKQPARLLIDYTKTDVRRIIQLALTYVRIMKSSLCKLVIYCNRSNDEQLDAKITIKFNNCNADGKTNTPTNAPRNSKDKWYARYNLPGTTHSTNSQRKVLTFNTDNALLKFLSETGRINLVELHTRGVKVSDDKEMMTLYYIID